MKKKIALILVFIAFQGYSQIENSLIGEWKAFAVNNGNIYYNSKNDSISLNTDSNFPSESLELIRMTMKATISDTKYFFNESKELKCIIAPGYEIVLIYEFDKEKEIINLYEENKNQSPIGNIEYQFNNSNLELKMTIFEVDNSFSILEKLE